MDRYCYERNAANYVSEAARLMEQPKPGYLIFDRRQGHGLDQSIASTMDVDTAEKIVTALNQAETMANYKRAKR